jgi:Beta-propeller repeat
VLFYSTYLGGSDIDSGNRIIVDATRNAYMTGETRSSNFPTTSRPSRLYSGVTPTPS